MPDRYHNFVPFSSEPVFSLNDRLIHQAMQDAESIDSKLVQANDIDSLVATITSKYELAVPVLGDDAQISAEQGERSVSAPEPFGPQRLMSGPPGPVRKVTTITYYVPFSGDISLFDYEPSSKQFTVSRRETVRIDGDNLAFTFDLDGQHEHHFTAQLQRFRNNLKVLQQDFDNTYSQVAANVRHVVERRKEQIAQDETMLKSTKYPLRKRGDVTPVQLPQVRKRLHPKPLANMVPEEPEPTLPTEDYENILEIISSTAKMMEYSPNAFQDMDEETLRFQFLVPLNTQYTGSVSGETFNAAGKTDILVRHEGGNLFIGECKIWKGPAALAEALEQILGYTTWRDTKTAIILFNRNKNTTAVLEKADEYMKSHVNYVSGGKQRVSETSFRYVFKNANDPERHFLITLLVFDIPRIENPSGNKPQ